MFVVKGSKDKEREVELVQQGDGVSVVVNGLIIAKLDNNDDRLVLVGGTATELTGLATTSTGHVQYVWDSDKDTSRSY